MVACSSLIELVSPFARRENVNELFFLREHSMLYSGQAQHYDILCLWLLPTRDLFDSVLPACLCQAEVQEWMCVNFCGEAQWRGPAERPAEGELRLYTAVD